MFGSGHLLSVRAGDRRIAYRETGSGDPVLLINGTGESSATFAPIAQRLGDRWRAIAYDARDTGSSSYVVDAYTPRDLAGDAALVIESLELGATHVIGYSLGGATAQELAIARPELVRSLVLLSTWARSDAWFVSEMRSWQAMRRAHASDEPAFLAALSVWLFSPSTFARDPEPWRMYDDTDEEPQLPDGWIRQCEADIAHDALDRLRGLDVPALVIVGEDDICTPPRFSAELCDVLPRARLVTVPSAGHAALFEQPDIVASAIESFLTEV